MKFEEHCAESERLFGQAMPQVHRWLDEFAGSEICGMRHRQYRHHLAGIAEARKLFGDIGAKVALQHIISDLKMDQWDETMPLPKDRKHYNQMGLF